MISRCTDPRNKRYGDYGGRGIKICKRWLESFDAFVADMGYPPEGHTLDRKDGSKGYYPKNCRWATRKQQQNNMKTNRVLEFQGKRLTLTQWAERLNINKSTLSKRLSRGRWPVAEALNTIVVRGQKPRPTSRI